MKAQLVKGVEVHTGSGNVFADLGLADADKLKIKTGLVLEIRKAMRSLGMTQLEAAKRMGITQPKVSRICSLAHSHCFVCRSARPYARQWPRSRKETWR